MAGLLKNDGVSTLRMMASELNVKKECIRLIITRELGKGKISARFVPYSLRDGEKSRRPNACKDLLQLVENDYYLDLVPTEFFIFLKLKHILTGQRIQSLFDIQRIATSKLRRN